MQRQQDCQQEDLYKQDLPGLPGRDIVNRMIRKQDDELEKENEGEEAQHLNDPSGNFQAAQHQ